MIGGTGISLSTNISSNTLLVRGSTSKIQNGTFTSVRQNVIVAKTIKDGFIAIIGTTGSTSSQFFGDVTIGSSGATSGVRFNEYSGTNYVGLRGPTNIGTSFWLTIPATGGPAGQVLYSVDGIGTLGWTTGGGGAGGPGTTGPTGNTGMTGPTGVIGSIGSWSATTGYTNGATVNTSTGALTLGAGTTAFPGIFKFGQTGPLPSLSTHTIAHGLGRRPIVQVFDASWNMIIPQNIQVTETNIVITFSTNTDCNVLYI
jgi:hypothetical protein